MQHFVAFGQHDCFFKANRGADRHRGPHKQTKFDCEVHGVRSSSLFWRVATEQGAGRSQHRDSRRRSRRERPEFELLLNILSICTNTVSL